MAIKYSSLGGGSGTGFNVQVGSQYSYATFTQAQPAGAYTIKSSNNYTNWDIYLLDASNNLVAYTGTASIAPTTAFSAIVVVNGTLSDILQFSFASTVFSTASTSQTKAGPFITAFGSSVIPNVNSAVTITGGNFAVGILATFTGTDNVVRACKSVVYTSTSSISVVRPDVLPVGFAPYVLTLTNPGINNPVTSGKHILTGLTVGNAPVWSTATSLAAVSGGAYSTTLVATDVEGAVTYSYVSGTLPAGLSFNASTGVISGTYSGFSDGVSSYTVRATDAGGNFTDRTFTLAFTGISGGTLTSDATYYYRAFTSNGTLTTPNAFTADVLMVAGGAGGGYQVGGGGGGGGYVQLSSLSIPSTVTVAVGAGGTGGTGGSRSGNGIDTTLVYGGTTLTATGGGGGSNHAVGYNQNNNQGWNGGSGGGGSGDSNSVSEQGGNSTQATTVAGQTGVGFGNAGGQGRAGSWAGGGGGGAGAVGNPSPSANTGGTGGSGKAWVTGTFYAGGGGGCNSSSGNVTNAGGAGGGGAGTGDGNSGVLKAGTPNTGGGGGGVRDSSGNGGDGGSGIVIVRYTRASVGG